jgi:hypothetical protein
MWCLKPTSDGHRDPIVLDGRHRDAHRVRAKLIEHLLEIGERLSAELLCDGCGSLAVEIGHTNQVYTRQVRIDARMVTSHRANTDGSGPNCHNRSILSPVPVNA